MKLLTSPDVLMFCTVVLMYLMYFMSKNNIIIDIHLLFFLQMKVNIREQLPKYLGEVKLLTTKCCILESEKLGSPLFGATLILKQFAVHKCGHDQEAKPAMKCLKSMLGTNNPGRYFIVTQDPDLREKCRKIPGTPILYLHHSAPVLEKPSNMSENFANETIEKRFVISFHSAEKFIRSWRK